MIVSRVNSGSSFSEEESGSGWSASDAEGGRGCVDDDFGEEGGCGVFSTFFLCSCSSTSVTEEHSETERLKNDEAQELSEELESAEFDFSGCFGECEDELGDDDAWIGGGAGSTFDFLLDDFFTGLALVVVNMSTLRSAKSPW